MVQYYYLYTLALAIARASLKIQWCTKIAQARPVLKDNDWTASARQIPFPDSKDRDQSPASRARSVLRDCPWP